MEYHIYHMFPNLLNLYGDRGNILTLCYFAQKIGLKPIVHEINDVSQIKWDQVDLMLLGGGSDREQAIVTSSLQAITTQLRTAIEDGLCLLALCGGYQFLGQYYQDVAGNKLVGLGVFDFYTVAQTKHRMVGNTILESNDFQQIIGFVNHAGETFSSYPTLGQALVGYGNNLNDVSEGLFYKNVIGTYLHGPLLPKNPLITLYFLRVHCLKNKIDFDFDQLDLSFEKQARNKMLDRFIK